MTAIRFYFCTDKGIPHVILAEILIYSEFFKKGRKLRIKEAVVNLKNYL